MFCCEFYGLALSVYSNWCDRRLNAHVALVYYVVRPYMYKWRGVDVVACGKYDYQEGTGRTLSNANAIQLYSVYIFTSISICNM